MTAEKFVAILKGDSNLAGGPVLKSNSNSTVFIFYSGRASRPGQAEFPGTDLFAAELMDAINYMNDHNMYKEMVIYWAGDYAGSMFQTLQTD